MDNELVEELHKLSANWRRIGNEHGVRQFTGNVHLLFANELDEVLTKHDARKDECPACRKAWSEHRIGYSASRCKHRRNDAHKGGGVSEAMVDAAWAKIVAPATPSAVRRTGVCKRDIRTALEAAGCMCGWENVVVDDLPEGYSLGHNEKFGDGWWVLRNREYTENKVYSTKEMAIAGAHRLESLRLRRLLDDMNKLIERARAIGGDHE